VKLGHSLVCLLLGLAATQVALAAAPAKTRDSCYTTYKPETGQAGKDVIWVPTNDALVAKMLEMAGTKATDRVYDLGAGDGKIAIAAAKQFGATAVGVEYDANMAKLGQCLTEAEGVADKVKIVQGDIFQTDFSSATVLTLYLLPELNLRLRPTILKMKPGTRVVSHSFMMEDWEPDDRAMTEHGSAYLWIVPASFEGSWNFRARQGGQPVSMQVEQKFQELSGTVGGNPLERGKVNGDELTLEYKDKGVPVKVTGKLVGNRIEATFARAGANVAYTGTR
jgi:SAM-dependent methyltransferase